MGEIRCRPGDRIRLVGSPDPWARISPGEEGTVLAVEGELVRVAWDSGWPMPVIPRPDGDEIELLRAAESSQDEPKLVAVR
jgi:hypothetical protein